MDEYFTCDKMQLSTLWTLDEMIKFVEEYCDIMYETKQCKIWKGECFVTCGMLQREIWDGINKKDKTFSVSCREL